jgi:hypothetical protein
MDSRISIAVAVIFSMLTPTALSAGPHLCAKPVDDKALSRLSKEELVGDFCSALFIARIAQEEAEAIKNQMPSSEVNSDADKKKWADLMAKGMFRMAERNLCIKMAQAYQEAYRSRFGNNPSCITATKNK